MRQGDTRCDPPEEHTPVDVCIERIRYAHCRLCTSAHPEEPLIVSVSDMLFCVQGCMSIIAVDYTDSNIL